MSEFYQDRVELLGRNARLGLLLVLLVLGLFLEVKLAFWVTVGIPITFIGAFFFLPSMDVSINMISLFAFIVVLGMVVDDAIIVGEAIFKQRQDGHGRLRAAILGCKDVAMPVVFAVMTTIFAFMPMLFVPGPAGKFFRVIPIVVISVFILSLIESLFILPAHLAHSKKSSWLAPINRVQGRFADALERFIELRYQPILRLALRLKHVTLMVAVATFLVSVGYCRGGRIQQTFLPKVDSDVIIAEADLPFGAPVQASKELLALMIETANETLEEFGGDELKRGLFAQYGGQGTGRQGDPNAAAGAAGGSHLVEVALYLVESDQRPMSGAEFSRRWRKRLEGKAAGLEALRFRFATGPSGGKPVHVEMSHPDQQQLEKAASVLAGKLADFTGTYDIDDGFARGKPQLDFKLTPEGRSLGVTEIDLARQIRSAFFGAEAVRQQRGREEVRVYVRLPDNERDSEYHVERLMIRTPGGGEIPLAEAASIERGRAYTEINRVDARRTMTVTSEVDLALGSPEKINARLGEELMPEMTAAFPGLTWKFGGERAEQGDVNKSLFAGFGIALVAMFALLAIAFRSYLQPLIVMIAIPFGFVGALWGHVIMGYGWSLMSLMGVVALSGIVINDSLILVVAVNRFYREDKMPLHEAVVAGAMRRFRPILLTSLTTFFGLAPMILETSVQARFLIPMAVSLGFGVMAATFITLLLVPAAYLILEENIIGGWSRFVEAWRLLLGREPTGVLEPDPEAPST